MLNLQLLGLVVGLVFFFLLKGIAARARRNPHRLPLPPGPNGLPLLGNTFQIPQTNLCEGYDKLCKEYGTYWLALLSRFWVVNIFDRRYHLSEGSGTRNCCARVPETRRRFIGQEIWQLLRSTGSPYKRYVSYL